MHWYHFYLPFLLKQKKSSFSPLLLLLHHHSWGWHRRKIPFWRGLRILPAHNDRAQCEWKESFFSGWKWKKLESLWFSISFLSHLQTFLCMFVCQKDVESTLISLTHSASAISTHEWDKLKYYLKFKLGLNGTEGCNLINTISIFSLSFLSLTLSLVWICFQAKRNNNERIIFPPSTKV